MASERWKKSRTAVYNVSYHLIWCPKYRRKVLTPPIDADLKKLLLIKAKELGVEIANMEVMPDRVYIFVKANPAAAPQWLVNQFKGYTSHELRAMHKSLRTKLPTLWTRSYYCESIGYISEATIKKYIEEQKGK